MSYLEPPREDPFSSFNPVDTFQQLENLPPPTKSEPSYDARTKIQNNTISPPLYQFHEQQEETHTPSYGGYPKMNNDSLNSEVPTISSLSENSRDHSNKIRDILSRYNAAEQQAQQTQQVQSNSQLNASWTSTSQNRYQNQQPTVTQPTVAVPQQNTVSRTNSAPPQQIVQTTQWAPTQFQPIPQSQQHQAQPTANKVQLPQSQSQLQSQLQSQSQIENSPSVINSVPANFQSYPSLPQQWQPPAIGTTKQEIKIEEVKQQQQAVMLMMDQMQQQFSKIMGFFEMVDRRLTKLENSTQEILSQQNSVVTVPYDPTEILHAAQQMQQEQADAELARRLQEEETRDIESKKVSTLTPRPITKPVEKKVPEKKPASMLDCPICNKKLSEYEIEEHVNTCLDKNPSQAEKSGLLGRFWGKKEDPKTTKKDEKKSPTPTPTPTPMMYSPYGVPPTSRNSYPGMQVVSPYGYPPGGYMLPNGQVVYYSVPQNP